MGHGQGRSAALRGAASSRCCLRGASLTKPNPSLDETPSTRRSHEMLASGRSWVGLILSVGASWRLSRCQPLWESPLREPLGCGADARRNRCVGSDLWPHPRCAYRGESISGLIPVSATAASQSAESSSLRSPWRGDLRPHPRCAYRGESISGLILAACKVAEAWMRVILVRCKPVGRRPLGYYPSRAVRRGESPPRAGRYGSLVTRTSAISMALVPVGPVAAVTGRPRVGLAGGVGVTDLSYRCDSCYADPDGEGTGRTAA